MEGDSEVVIQHFQSDSACLAMFGHIVHDIWLTTSSFRTISFFHVKRRGNAVAGKLAKLAKQSFDTQIWLEDIHNDATNLVMSDRRFLLMQ